MQYFMARCNHELEGQLRSMEGELAAMGTTQRVRTGVKLRLEMNIPYISAWSLAFLALPFGAYISRLLAWVSAFLGAQHGKWDGGLPDSGFSILSQMG
jgi:hypothetical protein